MGDYFETCKNNPLLRPIHGVSLEEYAAAMHYLTAGVPVDRIMDVLSISPTVWNEVHVLWTKRMEEDASLTVIAFFSRFYNEAEHNKRFAIIHSPNV